MNRPSNLAGRGQAVVEMALILPVFLLCVFGTLDLGRAVYAQFTLTQAVREGARKAVIETNSNSVVTQTVIDKGVALSLTGAQIIITGSRAAGSPVTVAATHTFVLVTPLISQIVGASIQLHASSTMTAE